MIIEIYRVKSKAIIIKNLNKVDTGGGYECNTGNETHTKQDTFSNRC